jgi:hypothetical protein
VLLELSPGIRDTEAADGDASDLDAGRQVVRIAAGEERCGAGEAAEHDDGRDGRDAPRGATFAASVDGVGALGHVATG